MMYYAPSYFSNSHSTEPSTAETQRCCNAAEDEQNEKNTKEGLLKDEQSNFNALLNSSTSESEGETEVRDPDRQGFYDSLPEQLTLSEEEREKYRPGKVFLMGASRNIYRSARREAKSSSDESELNRRYYLYITSFDLINQPKIAISAEIFRCSVTNLISHPFRVLQVRCGILVTVNNLEDVDKILEVNLPKIFGGPVQIANISKNDPPYRKKVFFRTIPWVITVKEIKNCLDKQGIRYGKIKRVKNIVKVEVFNAIQEERLLNEGLNFYNTVSFMATPHIPRFRNHYKNQEVIQCYNCQGFWHTATNCKNKIKCVRCGEHHELEKCERPKNSPICCNCHGNHHAAYKLCPTRLKMMSYINLRYKIVPRQPDFLMNSS
ncbi:hypothetical protein WA026_000385 [Henosepilachna vigintioctopunctata]|uniref:Uncharacterized protein n=1 Tax=Henosepilachna vigintioctopunctata TaxID=420089 RepID=A0AAW1V7Z1_9CUCU